MTTVQIFDHTGWRGFIAACVIGLLAGCNPISRDSLLSQSALSQSVAPVAPHAARPSTKTPDAASRTVNATWSFSFAADGCAARAASPELTLSVVVGGGPGLRLTLSGRAMEIGRPGSSGRLDFSGPDGAWTVPSRRSSPHAVTSSLPAQENSLNDVQSLLSGGVLRLHRTGQTPLLGIPDAGVAGRDWFGCVREKLLHPAPDAGAPNPV